MSIRGRSPAERSIADRIRHIWNDDQCQDLATQLEGAGYRLPFEASAAPLVATLFRDVIKGARYGKTAHKLLEERNARIVELEDQLKRTSLETQEGSIDYKSRLFRLLRLAGSSIYIASRVLKVSKKDDCDGWTSASTDLLNALLSYEKQIESDPPRDGYPPFLSEFHSLWKTIEERDMARAEVKEKENQITVLLAGKTNAFLPVTQTAKEEQLFVAVETLKARTEMLITQDPNNATQQTPLLQLLENAQKQVEELREVNRGLESEMRKVEKKFASHLKNCCSSENVKHARSASPALERAMSNHDDDSFIIQLREDKNRLQASLDARNNDISNLQSEIARLKLELHESSRKYASAVASDQMNREEIAAMQKRCELFEQEFRCLDERRISDETEIRRLNIDLEDAINERKGHKKTIEDMENAQLRVVALDRELSNVKESLENSNVLIERIEQQKKRLEDQCQNKDAEINSLRNEQDKLKEICKGMRSDCHQMQLNLARAQDELKSAHLSLRTLSERHQQLRRQADDLVEAEAATLRTKEEAVRDREAYRQAVKENRKEIAALKEDCEQLRQRNAFLLKSIEGTYTNDRDYSPTLPPSITHDKCDSEMLRELMDLKRENYVVREKCQGALTMLRNSIETRKQLQKEVNDLTVQVTALQAELEAAQDELELRGKSIDRPTETSIRTGSEMTSGAANAQSTETWPSVGTSYERTNPTTSRFGTDESCVTSDPQTVWPESRYTWMPTEMSSRSESAVSREPSFDLSLMGQRLPTPPPPNTMGPTPLPARVKSSSLCAETSASSQSRLETSLFLKSSFKQRAMSRIAQQTREAEELELKLSHVSADGLMSQTQQPRSASSVLSPTNYSQYIAENDRFDLGEDSTLIEEEEEGDDDIPPVDSHRSRVSMGYEVDHLGEDADETTETRHETRPPRDEPREYRNETRGIREETEAPRDETRISSDETRNRRRETRDYRDETRDYRDETRDYRDETREFDVENEEPLVNSLGLMSLSKSRGGTDSPLSTWTVSRDTERVTLQHSNSADRMISCWEFSDATSYRQNTDTSATPPRNSTRT